MITVSALMATTPARDKFRPRSLESFRNQIFPSDWKVHLAIDFHPTYTLGRKLNNMARGLEQSPPTISATSDYLIVWDDDDWYSPTRLSRQIQPLIDGYDYSGTSTIFYHDIRTDEGWQYTGNGSWLGALAFTRAALNRLLFNDTTAGVDNQWQMNLQGRGFDLKDPALLIASIHSHNACPKHTVGSNWPRAALPEFPRIGETK